jgi:hypothetical protein
VTQRDEFLEEERKWLLDHMDAYREGMAHLSDPNYSRGLLRGIEKKLLNALSYNPREDQPHVAVGILCELQARMEKVLTDLHFLDDYEERRDEIRKIDAEQHADGSHGGPPESDGEL